MKAHEWLILFTVLGTFAFRGVLDGLVLHLWCRFCEAFTLLSARGVRPSDVDRIDLLVRECLALAEAVFPASEFTIIFHLLSHCAHYIRRWGPYSSFWMFPYERYVGFLSRSVTSRKLPAAMLTRYCRFLALTEFYRPEIEAVLEKTPNGIKYLSALQRKRPGLGPELLQHRFHEDVVFLEGVSSAFRIPDADLPFLRAAFRLNSKRYNSLCQLYESERAAAATAARAAKRALVFPLMAAWSPRTAVLVGRDQQLLFGPSAHVRKFPRAVVGGVCFRSAEAEAKLKSRASFFTIQSSPDRKSVVTEYGRVLYFADVTFAGERIPVLFAHLHC